MHAFLPTENVEAIFEKPRRRQDEFYFNSMCLFRVLLNGEWRKTPFLPSQFMARFRRVNMQRAVA
jgi:hypothetical protein